MHAHIHIQCTSEAKMKFSCIWNAKKKRNEMYVDNGRAMATVSI